jgi:hypothetical protein
MAGNDRFCFIYIFCPPDSKYSQIVKYKLPWRCDYDMISKKQNGSHILLDKEVYDEF